MEPSQNSKTERTETPHKEQKDDLPMIVFLRGDEEIVEEFDLNADQAMEILGIKRSRLTQISGKELRVGKIRVDRYVRPVFRRQDVESYSKWTRPTASHKASADALKESYEKVIIGLSDKLQDSHQKLLEDISAELSPMRHPKHSDFQIRQAIAKLESSILNTRIELARQIQTINRQVILQNQTSSQQAEDLKQTSAGLEVVILKLGNISQNQKSLKEEIQEIRRLYSELKNINDRLKEIEENTRIEPKKAPPKPSFHKMSRLRRTRYR